MKLGDKVDQRQLVKDLVALQYKRVQAGDFSRGLFRVRGDTIEVFPAHYEDRAWRIGFFGDEIESIVEFDPLTGVKTQDLEFVKIYANSHYVTPRPTLLQSIEAIKRRAQGAPGPAQSRRAGCSRRNGSSSAPCSISKCWRRPAPAPASRTIRAI